LRVHERAVEPGPVDAEAVPDPEAEPAEVRLHRGVRGVHPGGAQVARQPLPERRDEMREAAERDAERPGRAAPERAGGAQGRDRRPAGDPPPQPVEPLHRAPPPAGKIPPSGSGAAGAQLEDGWAGGGTRATMPGPGNLRRNRMRPNPVKRLLRE